MASNDKPTKTSVTPSPGLSEAEVKKLLELLKKAHPQVNAPKKPIPSNVN